MAREYIFQKKINFYFTLSLFLFFLPEAISLTNDLDRNYVRMFPVQRSRSKFSIIFRIAKRRRVPCQRSYNNI